MWLAYDKWSYVFSIPTLWLGLYFSLDFVLRKTAEGALQDVAVAVVIALWANALTTMIYYRKRIKMLAPEDM